MSPSELRRQYLAGALPKPDYIAAMHAWHQVLFEYSEFLADTDVAAIELAPGGPVFRLRDLPFRMRCPGGEARVAPIEVLNFGRYEPAETRALLPLLKDCRAVLDVGANIGWFALWFAHHCPQAQIHAFEPVPQSLDYLRANIALNALDERISAHGIGLSDKVGAFDFWVYPTGSTNVSLANVSAAADARRIVAPTDRLDDWTTRQGVVPGVIKCDVEGAELLVFRGAERTLREHRPLVFTEMLRKWSQPFGYHPNDMIGYFAGLDYACYAVGAAGLVPFVAMSDVSVETNFVFVPLERVRAGLP